MQLTDAIEEFRLDCKMRKLADKTISNYNKQLKYLQRYLLSEFALTELEAVKQNHIRSFTEDEILKMLKGYETSCFSLGINQSDPTVESLPDA